MGQYPGSFKLEYLWHPEGRKPEIRSTHLREPTCNFHAQSESRRLARRCDAYPPTNWTTYKDRNEVGSFRRDFDIPQDWDGREVFISFDGVDSFFYLWINGQYVGFSKNSRNTANFNITPYLQKGKNTVAAEVYRSSDGSFLEAQDMFRLPGIFRTVALYSTPKVQVRDLVVIPDLTRHTPMVHWLSALTSVTMARKLPKDTRWLIHFMQTNCIRTKIPRCQCGCQCYCEPGEPERNRRG